LVAGKNVTFGLAGGGIRVGTKTRVFWKNVKALAGEAGYDCGRFWCWRLRRAFLFGDRFAQGVRDAHERGEESADCE
jgi:hypothetical protein